MITSFSNPTVKSIRKLENKKFRRETGEFFIEGLRTVGEAVQTEAPIKSLVIAPELLVSDFGQSLLQDPKAQALERIEVSTEVFEKLAHKQGPQGIGAIVRQNWHALQEIDIQPNDLWVALDAVADPGNLGTIMRSTDAVGGRGIVLIGDTTDPYDPNAVKASMGALFSLTLCQTPWSAFLSWQQKHGMMLVGTSDHASADYQAITYQRPLILLMGSERHGLSPEKVAACHEIARIPMEGRSDSLNLAVATGVMLYEIYNQSRNLVTIKP